MCLVLVVWALVVLFCGRGVCFAFSWLVLVAGVVVSKFGCGSWVCGWGMWWLRLGLCGKFGGWFLVWVCGSVMLFGWFILIMLFM